MINIKKHWPKGLVLLLSVLIVYAAIFANINTNANTRLDSSFKQALGVFASAKALNGVISLVQGTEVGPPGVTISIGEILDPINDLVERFSWIMLASLTSLGVQKILMNISTCSGFDIVLISSLFLVNILYFFKLEKYTSEKRFFYKFAILLIFLRFSIPFMSFTNDYVYENFIQQNYNIEQSQSIVSKAKEGLGAFDGTKSSFFSGDYYKEKMLEFEKLSNDAGDNIVDLIIIFIFQTILFPILFLFLLYKLIGRLFDGTLNSL